MRNTLRMLWPDLHAALMPAKAERHWGCALGGHGHAYAPVVGRLWRNGAPACQAHIDSNATRPGGWPLERISPR